METDLGKLRAALREMEHLPDDTKVVLEDLNCDQWPLGFIGVCAYGSAKNGKLDDEPNYSTERYVEQQEEGDRGDFAKLDKPVVMLSINDTDHSE
jgi:hypothetical protein